MKIEHTAFNVADPAAMADWYVAHLGLRIMRAADAPAVVRFLADDQGAVMLEIYRNDQAPIPDYAGIAPQTLHLAFVSHDVDADCQRLAAAGATIIDPPATADHGDRFAMLRDPWGLALQLVRRADPMI